MFKPQRRINNDELPAPQVKLDILQLTIEHLTQAGYVYIGMDHFARPDDELAVAQREGTLYRNFQGYSTHSDCDLVAMGATSISMVGNTYSQNMRSLEDYYGRIDADRLAIFRGIELTEDDLIRREVITQLICNFQLNYKTVEPVEQRWNIRIADYFERELSRLPAMQADGLLEIQVDSITVLPKGRLLIRNICMAFDSYLPLAAQQKNFSKVI